MGRRSVSRLTARQLENFREDLEAFGAPPAYVAAAMADFAAKAEPDQAFAVMAENGVAVRAFLALQTQWRWLSMSTMSQAKIIRTGLAYEAIEPTLRMRRIELGDDDFVRIQVLEGAALQAWAEEMKS